jgi:hypothetical protein
MSCTLSERFWAVTMTSSSIGASLSACCGKVKEAAATSAIDDAIKVLLVLSFMIKPCS